MADQRAEAEELIAAQQAPPDTPEAALAVVHELLGGADGFTPDQLRALNAAMGRYHRFQGAQVTRTWSDDLEAIHHFRAAGDHLAADALAERVAGA